MSSEDDWRPTAPDWPKSEAAQIPDFAPGNPSEAERAENEGQRVQFCEGRIPVGCWNPTRLQPEWQGVARKKNCGPKKKKTSEFGCGGLKFDAQPPSIPQIQSRPWQHVSSPISGTQSSRHSTSTKKVQNIAKLHAWDLFCGCNKKALQVVAVDDARFFGTQTYHQRSLWNWWLKGLVLRWEVRWISYQRHPRESKINVNH